MLNGYDDSALNGVFHEGDFKERKRDYMLGGDC